MRIQNKLLLVLVLSSSLVVIIMFALVQRSLDRGMLEYANTKMVAQLQPVTETLAALYEKQGNWQVVRDKPKLLRQALLPVIRDKKMRHLLPPPSKHDKNERKSKVYGVALVDSQGKLVAGQIHRHSKSTRIPIHSSQQAVGWLVLPKRRSLTDGFELRFIEQQTKALAAISAVVLLVAFMVALPLSRHFVQPIKKLAASTLKLTQGNYDLSLDTQRQDELGQLARDFNNMASTLKTNENNRKRWLANTSHELRTPLAILRGELEAMLDGVRPINADNIQSAQQEVLHLAKLIDDLYQLSNADLGSLRYQKTTLDLVELLEKAAATHRPLFEQQGLCLEMNIAADHALVWADLDRLQQLFNNLLANSQKYTDGSDSKKGHVIVSLTSINTRHTITIEDSPPGVPDAALPQLFDHLYRVENSRNRATGGSGLGLAICQQIVAAHDGNISAEHSELGGLKITVQLPAATQHS